MEPTTPPEHAPPPDLGPRGPRSTRPKSPGHGRPASSSEARVGALFSLLGDDSDHVWSEVRRELRNLGRAALPGLRRLAKSPRALERARARSLVCDLERAGVIRRLLRYALTGDMDLERAFFLLARLEQPNKDLRPYRRALDAMANEVRRRMVGVAPGMDRIQVLSKYLGEERGYAGPAEDFDHPDHIFIHRTLERRRGMPLTLTGIYVFVARRLGLHAAVVPLPGHVMLRLQDGEERVLLDPFHGGEARSERECLRYLAQNGLSFRASWFRDASDRDMFLRQVRNLRASYKRRGRGNDVRGLDQVIAVLNRAKVRAAQSTQS